LLAAAVYREPFSVAEAISFGLIWAALSVYSADTVAGFRRNQPAASLPPGEPL
jgi:EamA domain-containing membrane protein RarD